MNVTADLIRRYDRPGPRYTSYPTAAEFDEAVGPATYAERLAAVAAHADRPIGVYVHLPFCRERCHYCGCNVVITSRADVGARYLDLVRREIRQVADRLGGRRRVRQLHWGGGTPTWYAPEQLDALQATLRESFAIEPDAEMAVEIDPRVTTFEHLAALRAMGFNRLSLGVQDFTPEVQEAVNRVQGFESTRALVEEARRLGYLSVNVDLIYGLPKQQPATYQRTIEQVLAIRPERVAVYSYAHMPWIKAHQRRMGMEDLPGPDTKLALFAAAVEGFRAAGYRSIGMDHFALPEDDLGRAIEAGTLWRNFMGYTVRHAPDTIGFGMSAIGDVDGAYVQNERNLARYQQAVEAGALPVERGYALTPDDRIRRHLITALMCTFRVDVDDLVWRFGPQARQVVRGAGEALDAFERDGFVRRSADRIEVVGTGRLFVRNVCMAFDAYLDQPALAGRPRFSRTV